MSPWLWLALLVVGFFSLCVGVSHVILRLYIGRWDWWRDRE